MATMTATTTTTAPAPAFEIKVALIGYVSVGKTTVLNALFRDRYSHVYMTPTTAAVNHFNVIASASKDKDNDNDAAGGGGTGKRKAHVMEDDENGGLVDDDLSKKATSSSRTAESILKEITTDNAALRDTDVVHEKHFEVQLQQDLVQQMRPDTKLALIDIPGINEAGANSTKYRDYVTGQWHTFDCVICVLDGKQGVNTKEQMDLLEFVKECNNNSMKDVPVIFLCNKVDEPEYQEPQVLVREARQAVEKIFEVDCREQALETILQKVAAAAATAAKNGDGDNDDDKTLFPVFIPVSALHAFIYQSASLKTSREELFRTMDKDHIEKLGKENFGRQWRKLSDKEKADKAFEVVTDPEQCREGLETSNFDKFHKVLSYCVGGEETQLALIEKQIDVATARLSPKVCLAQELQIVMDRSKALGKPTNHLKQAFWNIYKDVETMAIEAFMGDTGPSKVSSLAAPMGQLVAYAELADKAGWTGEKDVVVERMKQLIARQIATMVKEKGKFTTVTQFTDDNHGAGPGCLERNITWRTLSIKGWDLVFGSMLLVASAERAIYEHFGRETLHLQSVHEETKQQLAKALSSVEEEGEECEEMCLICWGGADDFFAKGVNYRYFRCDNCSSTYYRDESAKDVCVPCTFVQMRKRSPTTTPPPQLDENGRCNRCNKASENLHFPGTIRTCLKMHYKNGRFEPVHPNAYKMVVGIDIPEQGPSDPDHFGHLLWKFCRFMESS